MKVGMPLIGICCVTMASCASPGYGYMGGPHGARTLVDARSEMATGRPDQPDQTVRMLKAGNLAYPTWAMLQHVCGTVDVAASIDGRGAPTDVHVVNRRFNIGYVADPGGGGQPA